jgi:hypothetical protein
MASHFSRKLAPWFSRTGFVLGGDGVFVERSCMKANVLPLPSPWNADAAILHLYRVWSGRGRLHLQQIVLLNPNMVDALIALWQYDHGQERTVSGGEVASGTLPSLGRWHLLRHQDGSGVIVIGEAPYAAEASREA